MGWLTKAYCPLSLIQEPAMSIPCEIFLAREESFYLTLSLVASNQLRHTFSFSVSERQKLMSDEGVCSGSLAIWTLVACGLEPPYQDTDPDALAPPLEHRDSVLDG